MTTVSGTLGRPSASVTVSVKVSTAVLVGAVKVVILRPGVNVTAGPLVCAQL